MFLAKIKDIAQRLLRGDAENAKRLEDLQILTGRSLAEINAAKVHVNSLADIEFRVFSQFGEDGIIQYLLHKLPAVPQTFVEFGVESYQESNTRFLLMNNNWRGLVMDSNVANIATIKSQSYYWRHDLQAVKAFITRDNINDLIGDCFRGDIGILSIDIDGMDYWVLDNINVVQPKILICEFNSVFGPDHAVTVPYNAEFSRSAAHSSYLFWGASLEALNRAATRKGMALIGCNTAGNNAFFVANDCLSGALVKKTSAEAYVESRFRESRGPDGQFNFLTGKDRLVEIADCKVTNLDNNELVSIRQIYDIR